MKKAVSLVLALTLALALAVPAWADGFTGIAFSSDAGVLLAQPGYQENRIPGKWSYDEEKQILTLNGVSLNEDIGLIENLISENRTLKIVLNGTNQLGYIDCSCDLVFEGDGSLSLIGSESLRCGSVTINGGTLNVNNIMCSKAHGAAGTFESSGNAIINAGTVIIGSAKSTPAFSDIMRCSNLTLNGGTVNATVVSGYVYCESDFSISEGIINITVKNADNECQIRCANFVQTGGLLNLTFANAFPDNEDAFSGFHCSRFEKKAVNSQQMRPMLSKLISNFI